MHVAAALMSVTLVLQRVKDPRHTGKCDVSVATISLLSCPLINHSKGKGEMDWLGDAYPARIRIWVFGLTGRHAKYSATEVPESTYCPGHAEDTVHGDDETSCGMFVTSCLTVVSVVER